MGEVITKKIFYYWSYFHSGSKEDIPTNVSIACGNKFHFNVFVDSNHSGGFITCWSQPILLIYVISAPIIWYSQRQNAVEISNFGYESIFLQIYEELVRGVN